MFTKIWNFLFKAKTDSVYVLVAVSDDGLDEIIVVRDVDHALQLYSALRAMRGGSNVTLASRAIDDVPYFVQRKCLLAKVGSGVATT